MGAECLCVPDDDIRVLALLPRCQQGPVGAHGKSSDRIIMTSQLQLLERVALQAQYESYQALLATCKLCMMHSLQSTALLGRSWAF